MTESFVFYKSFYKSISLLSSDSEKWEIIKSLCELAFEGTEANEDNFSDMQKIIYYIAEKQIKASVQHKLDGAKGGRPRKITHELNPEINGGFEEKKRGVFSLVNTNANVNVNVNDNVNDNVNVNENSENKKNKKFVKPSIDDVKNHIKEMKYSVNAEKFISYYESNGWKVGKNPMKDWKAALRTWNSNSYGDKKEIEADKNAEDLKEYFLNRKLP